MAATVASPPQILPISVYNADMNTIPDPRVPSPSSLSRSESNGSIQHPDLNNEVATLSTKLINSINVQTTLDDSLQAARHDLDNARARLVLLVDENKTFKDLVARGLLIKKEDYFKMEQKYRGELVEERRTNAILEKEKKAIEQELENLTSALFEEANTMVAAARKETEATERKNDQLRSQLRDTEALLTSQQEQLHQLKDVIAQLQAEKEEHEASTHHSTTPSTPGMMPVDKVTHLLEGTHQSPTSVGLEEVQYDHPLRFSNLISPVVRHDLSAYDDFQELLKVSKSVAPSSRASSGNFGGMSIGLGALTGSPKPSNGSTTSLNSSTHSPSVGAFPGAHGSPSSRDAPVTLPPLKDNKFYKRALAEDIEPTLRLDIAPGLSWLARRGVLNSMTDGKLVVEPHPPVSRFHGPVFACALCGENRKNEPFKRKHRFRTSENDDAQRYPLCDYCLGRVRATCDYISFLRMLRDGHWRSDTEEEQKAAWEESVKLRERMFWTRIGGGVVPAYIAQHSTRESPRSPTFQGSGVRKSLERRAVEGAAAAAAISNGIHKEETPIISADESNAATDGTVIEKVTIEEKDEDCTPSIPVEEEEIIEAHTAQELRDNVIESISEKGKYGVERKEVVQEGDNAGEKKEQRLSISIPGAFD